MHWVWITLGTLFGIVVVIAVVGALLPKGHVVTRRVRLTQPSAAVFAAITDVVAAPSWRQGLKSVELLPARDGKRCHRELTSFGPIDLLVEREEPERLLVLRIVTPKSPFGGTWTFALTADGSGTQLAITENGEVYNVIFRFLSRFVFSQSATIEAYLRSLAAKFGDAAAITD